MFQLAALFTDRMTLQQKKPIYIWGTSDKKDEITVRIDGEIVAAQHIEAGSFKLEIPAQEAKWNAVLELEGENKITLRNVDIGEVWIAGGQSNMEFLFRYDAEGKHCLDQQKDDHIRFYDVGEYSFPEEKSDTKKENASWDRWVTLRPDTAEYFSAVGLYFAKQIKETQNVPVAVIGCNWGGTTASTWLDRQYLMDNPKLNVYLDEYAQATKDLQMDEYIQKHNEYLSFMNSQPIADAMKVMLDHPPHLHEVLPKIPLLVKFLGMSNPMGPRNENAPGVLYENMLLQIAGYSCRGVIWYQGESDEKKADIYDELMGAMIRCWRTAWQDELPFLMVELAPFGTWMGNTSENYPKIRQQQRKVSETIEGVGTVSIMDAGMEKDIHPKRKRPVGERLALLARATVYKEDVPYQAPDFSGAEIRNGEMHIVFANTVDGLSMEGTKCNALEITVDGKLLKKYKCRASKDRLIVSSRKITPNAKIEIQYAWQGYCEVNLYNSIGLSARPFRWRTDNRQ